jgi:hypothetical protein
VRRTISIVLVCLLTPIAGHAAWDYVESRRLFSTVDELRRAGEPVSRDALGRWQRPTDAEEMRAARYYNAAGELAFRDTTRTNRPTERVDARSIARISGLFAEVAENRALTPAAAALIEAVLADQADALEMMDRGAALPFSRFPPHEFEDYPRTYSLENLVDVGIARTVLLASRGDSEAAARSLWSTLKLRRTDVRTVPWQSEHLIDLQYLLEHTRSSNADLRLLQDAFQERERPAATAQEIRESRAIAIESLFVREFGKRTDPLTPAANARWTWYPLRPFRPYVVRLATAALRLSQDAVNAAEQPWPARIDALRRIAERNPRKRRPTDMLVHVIRGIGEEGVIRDAVRLVHVRAAMTALAVERFRREQGATPKTLQDLVPAYLAQVPEDPFTGVPLRFAADANRYVIYSLGRDGRDDGGAVGPLPKYVWKVTTADIGLEIRRQD